MNQSPDAVAALNPLLAELDRLRHSSFDVMADTGLMTFVPDDDGGDIRLAATLTDRSHGGSPKFAVRRHAHGQIASALDWPMKHYERMLTTHQDLFAHMANGLLTREHSLRRLRVTDQTVRAFLSNAYRPRDNWDLMADIVLPVLADHPRPLHVKAAELTETQMYVKVHLTDFEMPVTPKVGDVIRGGFIIRNSEVGASSLGIYPYTDRLICLNGMTHRAYGQSSRHVGRRIQAADTGSWVVDYSDETLRLEDEAFYAKCRDSLRAILNEQVFEAIVSQMRELAGIHIEKPVEAAEVIGLRAGLTESERSVMLANLMDEGDLTAWGFLNAITRTGRDHDDADRRYEIEVAAGDMLETDRAWLKAV